MASCPDAAEWLDESWLKLIPIRTEIMWLGKPRSLEWSHLLTLDGVCIFIVNSDRNLGALALHVFIFMLFTALTLGTPERAVYKLKL